MDTVPIFVYILYIAAIAFQVYCHLIAKGLKKIADYEKIEARLAIFMAPWWVKLMIPLLVIDFLLMCYLLVKFNPVIVMVPLIMLLTLTKTLPIPMKHCIRLFRAKLKNSKTVDMGKSLRLHMRLAAYGEEFFPK